MISRSQRRGLNFRQSHSGALVLQILLASSLHVPPLPQYCFGTFPIHVFFGWLSVDFLQRYRLGIPINARWGRSLAFITRWPRHGMRISAGWDRALMSPSLNDQIRVAQKLNEYSDETAMTNVDMYHKFPVAMQALRVIMPHRARHSRGGQARTA